MSNIEEYTKNFKFMIPDFNVATWHTEIKENFVVIDALIANFVQAQQFQGAWKNVTLYHVGDLVYIGDKDSVKYGGLYKVLVEHITTDDNFDTYLSQHPEYYKLQGEMGAQEAALISQDWAIKDDGKVLINNAPVDFSAKAYTIGGVGTETNNAKYYCEQAGNKYEASVEQATSAASSAKAAHNSEQLALTHSQKAANSESASEQSAQNSATSAQQSHQSAQKAELEADRAERSSAVNTYRNIGDIFFTARTDTELNGAVECNGASYSVSDFKGDQAIGNLFALNKIPYVSFEEYQNAIDTNGSCRAFGWDGGDSFRVPTIPALLLTKEQAGVIGNGMTLGLTDGTNYGAILVANDTNHRLYSNTTEYGTMVGTSKTSGSHLSSDKSLGITTDPTKSGIVANLDTVQYRAMVQLANEATDEALIQSTSALQRLANLAITYWED